MSDVNEKLDRLLAALESGATAQPQPQQAAPPPDDRLDRVVGALEKLMGQRGTEVARNMVAGTSQPHGEPISNKGSPNGNPPMMAFWQREIRDNAIGMSRAACDQMDMELGAEKARRMRIEAAMKQSGNMKLTIDRNRGGS